jgi:hypothetical protein
VPAAPFHVIIRINLFGISFRVPEWKIDVVLLLPIFIAKLQ